jgi:hypothetical protein
MVDKLELGDAQMLSAIAGFGFNWQDRLWIFLRLFILGLALIVAGLRLAG